MKFNTHFEWFCCKTSQYAAVINCKQLITRVRLEAKTGGKIKNIIKKQFVLERQKLHFCIPIYQLRQFVTRHKALFKVVVRKWCRKTERVAPFRKVYNERDPKWQIAYVFRRHVSYINPEQLLYVKGWNRIIDVINMETRLLSAILLKMCCQKWKVLFRRRGRWLTLLKLIFARGINFPDKIKACLPALCENGTFPGK